MFTILRNSITADATDCNNDYYHLNQGSVFPMDGVNLNYTDSAVNLGSSTATWDKLYVENINVTTIQGKFGYLVDETILTATASSIEFTGLTENAFYRLTCFVPDCNANIFLILNGDSSASYSGLIIRGQNTTVSRGVTTAAYFYLASGTGGAAFIDANIYGNDDYGKIVSVFSMTDVISTTVQSICDNSYCLLNSSTLTSIKIMPSSGNFLANTHIMLWKG